MTTYYNVQSRFDWFFAEGVLVDNTRGHFTHCSQGLHSEKYYATRKISARIIYQNTEYGVFMLYQVVPVLSF